MGGLNIDQQIRCKLKGTIDYVLLIGMKLDSIIICHYWIIGFTIGVTPDRFECRVSRVSSDHFLSVLDNMSQERRL